jgi:hypothetical protein
MLGICLYIEGVEKVKKGVEINSYGYIRYTAVLPYRFHTVFRIHSSRHYAGFIAILLLYFAFNHYNFSMSVMQY